MRILSPVFALLLLAQDRRERCEHGARGAARPVDLARVEREYAGFARISAKWAGRLDPKLALDEPFDSGLPACRAREVRRVRREVPAGMVGRTILFGPPQDGLVFVTRAGRRRDLLGRLVASPEAVRRFDVRCAPTRITVEKGGLLLEESP